MKNASKKLWAIALALCLTLPLTLASCEGEPGPQGEPGIQGEKGEPGETGARGEKGDKGDTGAQGEKGDKGDTGAQGEKGDKGDTGAQGEKGDKGDTGAQGEKGDKGDTGAQGETGNGITSVKLTATDGLIDTYTVTFTDGTKTTFTVVNGADGVQGEQGEKGDVGADGKNAYELYCEQFGYEGTLEEWLEIISSEIFKEYTVVFDLNGGTGTEDFVRKVTVRSGHSVALTIPERTGYNFLGWYIGEGANEAKFDADDRVSHNMTLKAKWGIKTSTVTFLDYYGDVISTETVNWGEAATTPVAPTVTGYYFLKWDKAYDNITANTTVKALYAPVTYTVSFNTDGGSEVAAQEVYVGQSPMRPAEPYKYGHYFIGWYTDEACTVSYNFNKAFEGDTTVYALFKESKPIYTVQDLKNIANDVWGKYYLANDIDLEGETWEPIGDFYGTLDGEGHKICNFSMANTSSNEFGFFKSNNGTLKNVTFADFIVTVSNSNIANTFGVIVARNYGTIEECHIFDGAMSSSVSYSTSSGSMVQYCGGMVGINNGTIKDCSINIEWKSNGSAVCTNNTYSEYSVSMDNYLGGVAAYNYGTIEDCMSDIDIQHSVTASGSWTSGYGGDWVATANSVGCIVGRNADDGVILRCASTEEASLEFSAGGNGYNYLSAGLVVGTNYSSISDSRAGGIIRENGNFNTSCRIGGFVGENFGSINTCYSNVDVENVTSGTADSFCTGGFVGYNAQTIINCYSMGAVNSSNICGGFIGRNAAGGSVSKCFSTVNIITSANASYSYFVGSNSSSASTFKCFYGANVTVSSGGVTLTPEEPAATSKTEIELYSEEFLCDTLSWKKDVWNITGTGLPTLVWEGE